MHGFGSRRVIKIYQRLIIIYLTLSITHIGNHRFWFETLYKKSKPQISDSNVWFWHPQMVTTVKGRWPAAYVSTWNFGQWNKTMNLGKYNPDRISSMIFKLYEIGPNNTQCSET